MARDLGTATLGLASETGFPLIGGVDTGVLSFPAFAPDEGPRIVPQTAADEAALTWALGMDIYIPQPSGTFVSLVQTGDGDGELFLRDNGDGTAGIGIDGVYDGAVAFDAWTRIVVIFTQEGGVTVLRKFVDGVLVGTQDLGATDRFGVDPVRGLSLFNDNDGETAAGAVASVFYSTDVPSAAEVAGLLGLIPTPNAGGFFLEQPSQAAIEINFDDMDIAPRYGAADVFLDGFGFQTPLVINESAIALASQFGIAGPDGADIPVLDYAAYTPDEGVLVGVPPAVGDLSSYTAVWDINFDDLPGFQGLLQTDLSQDNDGELFIRSDGGIGINGDYDGTVTPGTWHRIAITVEDQGDGTATLSKYLDGAFLDDQTVDAARFTLNATTGFLLLADNDSETSTGYLSHFGLSEEVLDAGAIAALGGADGAGPFTETANTGGTPLPPTGTGTRTLVLNFDSSFRPYDEMTGEVMVSVDGGAFQSLLTLDTSTVPGGQSSLDRVNEAASLEFDVAEDATEVAFSFQLRDGGNDWWWAFDNLSLADADGNVIFAENFDGLTPDLQAAVDENIGILGWTPDAPEGWTRENALTMPQGATEWQGWSFATPEFWLSADGQNRSDFTLGTGVVAIADPDEWDDFNDGTQTGDDFDSTLTTPVITLELPSTPVNYQLGFDTYQETSEFGFQVVDVIDEAPVEAIQDNIKDLLISDDGTPTVIDLAAAFGAEATDFALAAADGTVVDAQIDGTALTLSAQTFGHSDITVTALVDGETLTENFRAIVAGENAYVFAVIPDTQDYTSNPGIAESFGNITSWIVDQKDSLEIFHAIHVGDIVQFGAESQWLIAEEAIGRLDGEVSYTLAVGNHDQQRPGFSSAFSFETDIDAYFTPEQVGATAAQGGGTYDGFDVGPDTFANGDTYADSIRNAYSTHTAPDGTKWLIFSLEFGMPDDVLRWAGEVIEDHLDHRVIIDTHSWQGGDGRVTPTTEPLTTDNDGWGYAIRENPRAVNGGEDAWREFASKYPNITFTFNGHNFMGGAETTVSYGAGDNPVFQTFVNYQNGAWAGPEGIGPNGGNGAVRLVVVDPDNDRYTTHTKLVELDTYYNDFPDHEEVFEGVDFGAPEEIAIAKAGETMVVNGDGISATVELDGSETIGETTGAAFEWFTADGEKLGDGEALSVQLQTGTTRLTLKVTDQNGNVSTDDKVVIVQTPAVQPEDAPIVIAHRGQSADRPEHTLEAYQLAIDNGADFIEPDLVSTADGVLVARHEPWLATVATDDNGDPVLDENGDLVVTFASTDVALRPEFADRLTTKNIGFSSDGLFGAVTGWFAEDFTLAEIKTLRAVEDQPELRPQSAAFDGQFEIPTLAEVIQLVKDHEAATGEKIGIYPETKEPTYFDSIGLSLEENLVQTLIDNDFTDPDQIFIQSFEIANLLDLQENILPDAGIDLPLVQLLFNAPTFGTFDLVNEALTGGDFSAYASLGFDATSVSGDLFSVEGLQTIADVYAEGIGPSFSLIDHGDGTFSDLVDNAQDAGLLVHAYTHRDESGPSYETYLASGVDGIFTDNSDTGRAATDALSSSPALLTETFDDGDLDGWGAPVSDPEQIVDLGTDLGFALPSIGGVTQIPITLQFDSSFRPYDNQTGEVLVSFDDGATFSSLLTLDASTVPGGSSSLARANETVTLEALAPNSASNIQFAFRMSNADNDWWWAIDNVSVGTQETVRTAFFAEDFESLTLEPFFSPTEGGGDGTDWTTTPPDGWTRDLGATPAGVPEFEPWAFLDKTSWVATAGNQARDTFTRGQGTVAVADGDEYTDAGGVGANEVNAFFETPEIDLTGLDTSTLQLSFDSSFRPYADQTGTVDVSFDGGTTFSTLLTLDNSEGNSVLTRANEAVVLDLDPAGEDSVIVRWGYNDADNDWWWAIDNVALSTEETVTTPLLAEDFDALADQLQSAVDENIAPEVLGWTDTPPEGWTRENADTMPQGTTEWQGWSFATPEFWLSADGQNRSDFTLGTGVVAIADPDEWDDFNDGSIDGDDFDSTLATPLIDITGIGGGQTAGGAAGIVRIPALTGDEGLLLTPTASSGQIDSYSIVFDILVSETDQTFTALFQTDVTNSDDADIYLRNDGGTYSLGISGDYDGAAAYGEWARIALTFETDGAGQQVLTKYLDGVLLDTQVVDADVSDGSRWSINADDGLLLFSEPNGFTSEVYVNALHFTPDVLDADTIASLGGADVDGPAASAPNAEAFQLNFDPALDSLDYGTATLDPVNLAGADATSYIVKGSIFGNPDGEGKAALYQQSNGGNERLIWLGDGAETWSGYVFDMVIEPADNDTVGALFYYTDEENHYRLTMDQQNDLRELVKVAGGVETVLASETASYRHYAKQDLRIAVIGDQIVITLDDEALFGGPVTDDAPLAGGSVGILTAGMDRVEFDNIAVNPVSLAARVLNVDKDGRYLVDLDGDGTAVGAFTAHTSLSAAGIDSYEWLVDDAVVATGSSAAIDLDPGETIVTLRVTDGDGNNSTDQMTVTVADNRAILVADDFEDGNFAGWTIVDEGDINGPSDWQVVDGALVQVSDIQSAQQGTGSTAFSVAGDGPFILRDGTYALWEDPEALAWTDYAFQATITPNDDDGIGLLFRYTDPDNFYKLEADAQTGLVMLTRQFEGRETILARGYGEYTPGEAQDWRVEIEGSTIRTFIDGKAVFGTEVDDRTLTEGTVGLYGWGSENLTFDDVVVTDLGFVPPPPADLLVQLIDADSDTVIAELGRDGTEILASQIVGKDLTIAAFVPDDSEYAGDVESIRLDLNNGERTRLENFEPYSLFSDFFTRGREDYRGREGILDAENQISFDLFTGNKGRGDLLDTITRSFTVIDDVVPTEHDLRIVLVDARRNTEIAELTDGAEIALSDIQGKKLSVAAFVEDQFQFDVDSARVTLNDDYTKVENFEPYSLFGDWSRFGWENYSGRRNIFDEGENTIEFDLYTDNHLRGDNLGTVSVDFTVVDDIG